MLKLRIGGAAFAALFLLGLSGLVLWFVVFAVHVATQGVL
jgi:hypothetical protein